jgi:hypothetical protein
MKILLCMLGALVGANSGDCSSTDPLESLSTPNPSSSDSSRLDDDSCQNSPIVRRWHLPPVPQALPAAPTVYRSPMQLNKGTDATLPAPNPKESPKGLYNPSNYPSAPNLSWS